MSFRTPCRSVSLCLVASFAATTAHATNYVRSYLVNSVLLPLSGSDYAIDVDGDSHADNRLGQIFSALAGQNMDFQGAMNSAVTSGDIVHLVHLQSTDALFHNDAAAQATWCIGVPAATPPLFDGTDSPSCADTSGIFIAGLSSGSFTSPAPATAPNPVSLDFELALGTTYITLPVLNARLSFVTNAAGNIQAGQINGSIPHTDFMNTFPPAMAAMCNEAIQSDPSSGTATACSQLFDLGCSGFPGYAQDGQIEVCEITESPLIKTLLAPDVQVADGGTVVDAISVGVGFTAVRNDRVFASGFEL